MKIQGQLKISLFGVSCDNLISTTWQLYCHLSEKNYLYLFKMASWDVSQDNVLDSDISTFNSDAMFANDKKTRNLQTENSLVASDQPLHSVDLLLSIGLGCVHHITFREFCYCDVL